MSKVKVKKYRVVISFIDEFGDNCSIVQNMSNNSIGTWCRYFISQGCQIVGVDIPELLHYEK